MRNAAPGTGFGGQGALYHHRRDEALAAALTDRLDRLATALDGFSWPSDTSPWSRARLVIRGRGAADTVQAEAAPAGSAVPFYKYFSETRRSLGQEPGIEAGDYAFRLVQGGKSRTVPVSVATGDTYGDVLATVQNAINATDLSVRADIVRQQAPFTLDPSLAGRGYALALSVNPARPDQDVTLADTRGHLLDRLGLAESAMAAGPAEPGTTLVRVGQTAAIPGIASPGRDPGAATTLAVGRHDFAFAIGDDAGRAQPTTYLSKALDAGAATSLAPGTYAFGLDSAGQTRELSVTVRAGWTWGDVLRGVGAAISGQGAMATDGGRINAPSFAIPGIAVSLDDTAIPSAVTAGAATPGQMLTVRAQATDEAHALKLTDGQGGVLAALGLTTALRGTPVSVTVQAGDTVRDVARSVARAAAMTSPRLTAAAVDGKAPSSAVPGRALSAAAVGVDISLADKKISQTLTLTDGATGILAALALDRKRPGLDGEITASGRDMVSENDAYSLEQGRLLLAAGKENPEDLPLTVVSGMGRIESGIGGVVAAYNDVLRLIFRNRDIVDPALRGRLEAPVLGNMEGLARLGMSRSAASGELWINGATFWNTLAAEGPGARDTLAGGGRALIPGWKRAVAGILDTGTQAFLPSSPGPGPRQEQWMRESDLVKTNRLVDLLG